MSELPLQPVRVNRDLSQLLKQLLLHPSRPASPAWKGHPKCNHVTSLQLAQDSGRHKPLPPAPALWDAVFLTYCTNFPKTRDCMVEQETLLRLQRKCLRIKAGLRPGWEAATGGSWRNKEQEPCFFRQRTMLPIIGVAPETARGLRVTIPAGPAAQRGKGIPSGTQGLGSFPAQAFSSPRQPKGHPCLLAHVCM